LFPSVLVVANQFSLILKESDLRNFSAFEEKVDAVLCSESKIMKRGVHDSGWFQSFAEKVRKFGVFECFDMMSSG
jgi:hypothetical protein